MLQLGRVLFEEGCLFIYLYDCSSPMSPFKSLKKIRDRTLGPFGGLLSDPMADLVEPAGTDMSGY